jgi:RNA polymerase sigma-70 factor (ECF subfamily)
MHAPNITEQIAHIARGEAGRVIAMLIGRFGDFGVAEDAWQDALVAALEHWPAEGIPPNPGGWLMTAARRKALDQVRRRQLWEAKQPLLLADLAQEQAGGAVMAEDDIPDDRLRLLFTCCHPALNFEARVALTLRTLGGLATTEIARLFFVAPPTMAQRLSRAKQKIRDAGIPYRVPPRASLPERVPALLAVLYLSFTAGYTTLEGDALLRRDLCAEALRLTRVLVNFLAQEWQEDSEAIGLLALLLLQDSRRDARTGPAGELILLEAQDRMRWDHAAIAEGCTLVERALRLKQPGPYQIQAAIAAVHAQAARPDATDWPQIAALYDVLLRMQPTPVVALNRAVAHAMADGPLRGLALLRDGDLAAALGDYHLYHAARADLLRRVGQQAEARAAYAAALACAPNTVERAFLERRLREVARETAD